MKVFSRLPMARFSMNKVDKCTVRVSVQLSEIKDARTAKFDAYLVEYQENVVERNGTNEVEEEPRFQVVLRYKFGVQDNLLSVVLLHNAWRKKRKIIIPKAGNHLLLIMIRNYFDGNLLQSYRFSVNLGKIIWTNQLLHSFKLHNSPLHFVWLIYHFYLILVQRIIYFKLYNKHK